MLDSFTHFSFMMNTTQIRTRDTYVPPLFYYVWITHIYVWECVCNQICHQSRSVDSCRKTFAHVFERGKYTYIVHTLTWYVV